MKNKDFLLEAFEKGLYSCNEQGCIFSHQKRPNDKFAEFYCRKLKDRLSGSGYLQIVITVGEIRKSFSAHQVVFLFFNRDADFTNKNINHINHDKTCNILTNLELVTQSENLRHAVKNDRAGKKLNISDIKTIRALSQRSNFKDISEKFKVSERTIRHIIDGESWVNI